jgi:hypothetical protein
MSDTAYSADDSEHGYALIELTHLRTGATLVFDPGKVTSVDLEPRFEGNPDEIGKPIGPLTTHVHGITDEPVPIAGSIDDFLARIKMEKQFVMFTTPMGTPAWVKASAVSLLRAPIPLEEPAGLNVKCIVTAGGKNRGIAEDVQTAKAAINKVRQGAPLTLASPFYSGKDSG